VRDAEAFEQGGGVVAKALGKGGGSKLEHRWGVYPATI
jgi:hypothetical protein